MSFTWSPEQEPPRSDITFTGWIRVALRGIALFLVLFFGVAIMAMLRLLERPIFGLARPWTPHITVIVCRLAFVILAMRHSIDGTIMREKGGVVANHSSWLDIFSLNASKRIYFVSKSEVANWPGIGLLARITGTVFIARDPRQAKAQQSLFEARLLAGHKLLFFPEGTSTDGFRVLGFKSTLFEAFFNGRLRSEMHIQPVTVIYSAPDGQDPRFYGWWGDMEFGQHLLVVLAARRNGSVRLIYHSPVRVDAFDDRKALAAHVEKVVRGGMPVERQLSE